jgi:hypothetical protein
MNQLKKQFPGYYELLSKGQKDIKLPQKVRIKPQFLIEKVIGSYYDKNETPIMKEEDVYRN